MKNKLNLNDFKVKSFVTTRQSKEVKGGEWQTYDHCYTLNGHSCTYSCKGY